MGLNNVYSKYVMIGLRSTTVHAKQKNQKIEAHHVSCDEVFESLNITNNDAEMLSGSRMKISRTSEG